MANYYIDFVGLNTYIYEPAGGELERISEQLTNGETVHAGSTFIGIYDSSDNSNIEKVLEKYKNNTFSTATSLSIATPTLFTALMLRRNGPYGWPAFKSSRIGQNPLSRRQIKNNILPVMSKAKPKTITNTNGQFTVFPRKGKIVLYDEPSVVARHKPLVHIFGFLNEYEPSFGRRTTKKTRIKIKHSFDNRIYNFTNEQINRELNIPNRHLELLGSEIEEPPASLEDYVGITGMYLDGAIDDPDNPIDEMFLVRYKSTIFPVEKYTFKSYVRQRTTFTFLWRDSLAKRQQTSADNDFGSIIRSSSIWPLDVDPNWATDFNLFDNSMVHVMGRSFQTTDGLGTTKSNVTSSFGILWNHYAQGAQQLQHFAKTTLPAATFTDSVNDRLRPAPYYARRHLHPYKESVTSPTGLLGIRAGEDMASTAQNRPLYSGEAFWDAPSQAPSSSGPFYDSYDEYAKDIRLIGKNYSIVPEFKISDFVEEYETRAVDEPIANFLSIKGGPTAYSNSSVKKFYDTYTTTELLSSFDFLVEDHEDFAKPTRLTITCKAISKFLPYDGFYPVQRTVQLASQFHDSYKDHVSYASQSVPSGIHGFLVQNKVKVSASFQALLEPLFAPGALYNSIKAGVACDWPTKNFDSASVLALSNKDAVKQMSENNFDRRIPFEALVEPHTYLSNIPLKTLETVGSGSWDVTSSWDGNGDNLYSKMAHNFLGEVPNFFLRGRTFSAIASRRNKNINFVTPDTTYAMRVQMYRSMNEPRTPVTNSYGVNYFPPQDIGNGTLKETMTMYSRPSAFGPEVEGYFRWTYAGSSNVIGTLPEANEFGIAVTDDGTYGYLELKSEEGLNYPYTPPYYHGHAWADIVYKSGTRQGRVPLDEIIASSSISYWRFDDSIYRTSTTPFSNDTVYNSTISAGQQAIDVVNDNAMKIDSSLNLLGFAQVGEFNDNVIENQENSRWVIQTKFETPILNFKKYEQSSSITVPNNPTSASVPRGMWHQFGEIPTRREGIYMEVKDVPQAWNISHGRNPLAGHLTSSLADLVGFQKRPLKLGRLAQATVVKEGVVMIPYVETSKAKQFFRVHDNDLNAKEIIRIAKHIDDNDEIPNYAQHTVGQPGIDKANSLVGMVNKMRSFVIPPQMDFVSYPDAIMPFIMYIFDFEYTFTRQDLQYIWQGLKPPSSANHEMLSRTITHKLEENNILSKDDLINNKNIKWMVFKVKQRANTNYYDKIYLQAGESNFRKQQAQGFIQSIPESLLLAKSPNKQISYNWPYDFFSFVELIKIDAAVNLKAVDDDDKAVSLVKNPERVNRANEVVSRNNRPFSGDGS